MSRPDPSEPDTTTHPAGGPRILLVRTSALGDVVHCLPTLATLRRHLPDATIAWVVEEVWAPLLAGHPQIDRLIPVRLKPWRKAPFAAVTRRELGAAVSALRAFRPDVALDLMGNHKAGVLARLSGAPRRIGLRAADRRERSSAVWMNETVPARGVHAVERALSVAAPVLPPGALDEPVDLGGRHLFPDLLRGRDPDADDHLLLHPGAGWGSKTYPAARWGEVARRVAAESGLRTRVALSPSPAEREMAATVVATSDGAADTVEAGDLATLVALSRRARLVLGGDTGPLHLAHALGTPVLLLHGPTDPERHGPFGAPERALARVLPCSFCYRRFDGTKACLLEIPPPAVARRVLELLDDRPADTAPPA